MLFSYIKVKPAHKHKPESQVIQIKPPCKSSKKVEIRVPDKKNYARC